MVIDMFGYDWENDPEDIFSNRGITINGKSHSLILDIDLNDFKGKRFLIKAFREVLDPSHIYLHLDSLKSYKPYKSDEEQDFYAMGLELATIIHDVIQKQGDYDIILIAHPQDIAFYFDEKFDSQKAFTDLLKDTCLSFEIDTYIDFSETKYFNLPEQYVMDEEESYIKYILQSYVNRRMEALQKAKINF